LFLQSPPDLILASTSIYRRELLCRLAISFSCVAPGIDETALPGESGADLVARLAQAKAAAVAADHPDAWVIGSDQVAVRDDAGHEVILGKPGSVDRCRTMLLESSGREMTYFTGVTLLQARTARIFRYTEKTRVRLRNFDAGSVDRYIDHEKPLDCAGGLKSETLGIALCDAIETRDPSALIGLPLIRLSGLLREAGFLLP
jgi:septum formation protein